VLEKNPHVRSYPYIIRGEPRAIENITTYGALSKMLSEVSRSYYCDPACPSEEELALLVLDQKEQLEGIRPLAFKITQATQNKDDQVRIAISLVQNIPYNMAGFLGWDTAGRYPYEVLYENLGVCGEKSQLLALLLREIGYGVALLRFNHENHMAVGIKCPKKYSFRGTGYCFVETSLASIPTDDQGDYTETGKLVSAPEVIVIADGMSFDSVQEEWNDAQALQAFRLGPRRLEREPYNRWVALIHKYGIHVS